MAKIFYIISVGKLNDKNIKVLLDNYIKRINPYFKISEIEIKESGFSDKIEIEKESDKIIEVLPKNSFIIVCDQFGIKQSSQDLFNQFDKIFLSNKSLTIVIGGAFGLSIKVKEKADMILSLSDLTFTHQLAKLIVVEQIYRYCMFKANHPFVK